MVRDTLTECYRTLQLAPEDQGKFKSAVIKGIEAHQTYHRDLHDLSKKDVEDYAIDFFFDDTNLSFWWPQWPEDQRRMWWSTNQTKLEQALITLFDYWIEHERKVSRKKDSPHLNSPQSKTKKPRTASGRSNGHFRRRSEPEAPMEEQSPSRPDISPPHHGSPAARIDDEENADPILTTSPVTNGTLPNVHDSAINEADEGDEDSDGLPSVTAILRGYIRPRPRLESQTIEPQSPPLSNHKGKPPIYEQDSTYVESQNSTIGQPPLSPPPTRHREQLKRRRLDEEVNGIEIDESHELSPLAKRGRSHQDAAPAHRAQSEPEASSGDEDTTMVSQTLRDATIHSPSAAGEEDNAEPNIEFDLEVENGDSAEVENHGSAEAEESNTQHESQDQYDAFEELSKMLNRYLRECRDDTLTRANDPSISRRESRKLHIKSGLLHHLYGDVMSRIRAVDAHRKGVDESNKISFHTLHS